MATPADRLCGYLFIGVKLDKLPSVLQRPVGRVGRVELDLLRDGKDLIAGFLLHLANGTSVELPTWGTWSTHLLRALGRLVLNHKVHVMPETVCLHGPGPGVVRVGVALPARVWDVTDGWQGGIHAVTMLNALQPLESLTDEAEQQAQPDDMGFDTLAGGSDEAAHGTASTAAAAAVKAREHVMAAEALHHDAASFGLDAAFKALPRLLSEPTAPRMLLMGEDADEEEDMGHTGPVSSQPRAAPLVHKRRAAQAANGPQHTGSSLRDVPTDVLRNLLSTYLSPRDLAAVNCTCRHLRTVGRDAVPGLNLHLFPHQRAAVRWMQQRELARTTAPHAHPFIVQLVTAAGLHAYANLSTGDVGLEPPPALTAVRGGFFCDEPGLGKTVTAMSLVLKTKGTWPVAPPGVTVNWQEDEAGHRMAGSYRASALPGAMAAGVLGGREAGDAQVGVGGARRSVRRHLHAKRHHHVPSAAAAGAVAAQLIGGPVTTALDGVAAANNGHGLLDNGHEIVLNGAHHSGSAHRLKRQRLSGGGEEVVRQHHHAAQPAPSMEPTAAGRQHGTNGDAHHPAAPPACVVAGQDPGQPSNIAFFAAVLTQTTNHSRDILEAVAGVVAYLANSHQHVAALTPGHPNGGAGTGVRVPRELFAGLASGMCSEHYPAVFTAMGLVPLSELADGEVQAMAACTASVLPGAHATGAHVAGGNGQAQVLKASQPNGMAAAAAAAAGAGVQSPIVGNGHTPAAAGKGHKAARAHAQSTPRGRGQLRGGRTAAPNGRARTGRRAGKRRGSSSDEESSGAQEDETDEEVEEARASRRERRQSAGAPQRVTPRRQAALTAGARMREGRMAEQAHGSESDPESESDPPSAHDTDSDFDATDEGGASARKKGKRGGQRPAGQQGRHLSTGTLAARGSRGSADHQHTPARATREHGDTEGMDVDPALPTRGRSGRKAQNSGRGGSTVHSGGWVGSARVKAGGVLSQKHTWVLQPGIIQHAAAAGVCVEFDIEALRRALIACVRASGLRAIDVLPKTWALNEPCDADMAAAGVSSSHMMVHAAGPAAAAGGSGVLHMSMATLVVVPPMLVSHWRAQLQAHVAQGMLRVYELVDNADPITPAQLARGYDVVLTTFQRLSAEWEPKHELTKAVVQTSNARPPRVLQQVHWLRVILDEGHMLGASLAETNKLQVAVGLAAERRWVMTGTPTPAAAVSAATSAQHLQPLLAFLHHEPFGTSKKAWDAAVARRLDAHAPDGQARLVALLRATMIRASKADLEQLPPCHTTVTLLDFAPEHAESYNELVEVVRRNLLLADWGDESHHESLMFKGASKWAREMMGNVRLSCCVAGSMSTVVKEEDVLESLMLLADRHGLPTAAAAWAEEKAKAVAEAAVAQAQMGAAREAVADGSAGMPAAPAALEGATSAASPAASLAAPPGKVQPPGGTGAAQPTAPQRRQRHAKPVATLHDMGFTGGRWLPSSHPLAHVEDALRHGTTCELCRAFIKQPMVTPCRHLLCLDCIATNARACPLPSCRNPYIMQPVEDPDRKAYNDDPKWPVPIEVIEWQPVYHQDGAKGVEGGTWSASWEVTRSTRCVYLLKRLREVGAAPPRRGHTQYSSGSSSGQAGGGPGPWGGVQLPPLPGQEAAEAAAGQAPRGILRRARSVIKAKAIVFSQFWMHLKLLAQHLTARNVPHCVLSGGVKHAERVAAVNRFAKDPDVGVLLMDEMGAVGLDLSFVSYVFLAEPIADRSLQEQIVSRAHRMGAMSAVHVELLAMRGTAEEEMLMLSNMHPDACKRQGGRAGVYGTLLSERAAAAAAAAEARAAALGEPPPMTGLSAAAGGVEVGDGAHTTAQGAEAVAAGAEEEGGEEEGGATATVTQQGSGAAGSRGRQVGLENRGMRNLFFLHLRKVKVGDLKEFADEEEGEGQVEVEEDAPGPAHPWRPSEGWSSVPSEPRGVQPVLPPAPLRPWEEQAGEEVAVQCAASTSAAGAAQVEPASSGSLCAAPAQVVSVGVTAEGLATGSLQPGGVADAAPATAPSTEAGAPDAGARPKRKGVRFADDT